MQTQLITEASPLNTLFEVLRLNVASLQNLAQLLRTERESVVFFDVQALMGVLEDKNRMLGEHQSIHATLQMSVKAVWNIYGPRHISEPDDLPESLRLVGETIGGADGLRLIEFSSEVVALIDVVRELHDMNKELVQRSVGWITSYVADLVGSSSAGTYDVTGRMGRGRQTPQLVRRLI